MNVKINGGGTFIFPNTFFDLPKTRRVWAYSCLDCFLVGDFVLFFFPTDQNGYSIPEAISNI